MIDIVVGHAAGAAGRRASLDRLRQSLGADGERVLVVASQEKQHANVWAVNCWKAIVDVEAKNLPVTATLILNDDVVCHPDIMRHVATLAALFPNDVLSLHGNFPLMRQHALRGAPLVRCYWPSGPAMVLPRGFAYELLAWLETVPKDWFSGDVNEDGAIASFLWTLQRPTITTCPALVKHDTTVPSTLPGFDEHPNRTSWVPWKEDGVAGFEIPDWSKVPEKIPYVPVPWMPDASFKALGDVLRGEAAPVLRCSMCQKLPAFFTDPRVGRGICKSCASDLVGGMSQWMKTAGT